MCEYYFSKKLQEIAALDRQGKQVINLGVGSPDRMPPLGAVVKLMHEAEKPDTHAYQSYRGIPELREAFAGWYRRFYGVELDPVTEIQPLAGSKEGILLLSLAFLNKGDKVLVPDPGYPTYTSAARLAEAEVVTYDLREENGWLPDFEELERMNLEGVKMMWTNYPNMPTGARADEGLFRCLVEFGRRHGILVCNDNPYSFILNDEHLSILAAEGAKECCVELNSLSKAHNMAGWRVGMVAGAADIVAQVLKVKSNMDSGMFRPLQLAAVKALEQGEEWYGQLNREYRRRQKLAGEIFDLLGVRYDTRSSGMFLWGRVGDSWRNGEALSDFVLGEARVFITPGFVFGRNGQGYVRISLCAPVELLEEALERLRKCMRRAFSHGSFC